MSVNDFIQDYLNDKDQYFSIFKLKEQLPKIRMSQIWEREYPFFGSRHPPFMAGGGTPHPRATRAGWEIMLLKNRSGSQGTSHFWERRVLPRVGRRGVPPIDQESLRQVLSKTLVFAKENFEKYRGSLWSPSCGGIFISVPWEEMNVRSGSRCRKFSRVIASNFSCSNNRDASGAFVLLLL
jgi:hypothetical protein